MTRTIKTVVVLLVVVFVIAFFKVIVTEAIKDIDNREQRFLKECVEDGNSDFQCDNWWFLRSH